MDYRVAYATRRPPDSAGIIREKGLERVTVEMLVNEVTPKARGSVPEEVKRELLQEIRDYLQSQP